MAQEEIKAKISEYIKIQEDIRIDIIVLNKKYSNIDSSIDKLKKLVTNDLTQYNHLIGKTFKENEYNEYIKITKVTSNYFNTMCHGYLIQMNDIAIKPFSYSYRYLHQSYKEIRNEEFDKNFEIIMTDLSEFVNISQK